MLLASILLEMLSLRIAAQSTISLVLAPLAAAALVPWICTMPLPSSHLLKAIAAALASPAALLPTSLRAAVVGLVATRAAAVTATAALLVSQGVPLALSLIDEFYTLRSARTAARALRAARRRRREPRLAWG